jgi:hypothetical protein
MRIREGAYRLPCDQRSISRLFEHHRLERMAVVNEHGLEAHFHIFTASEANEFRNILHLSLISLFDIAGASTTTDFHFFASHDEYIDVAWYEGASWLPTMKSFLS